MTTFEATDPITSRLSRVESLETDLLAALERDRQTADNDRPVRQAIDRMARLANTNQKAILALRREFGPEGGAPSAGVPATPPIDGPLSALLERRAVAVSGLIRAYGALYATSRLLYQAGVCKLANTHAVAWRDRLDELDDLLPAVVIRELVADGATCRCVCPACGVGVCLCLRNSIDTVRDHRYRPGMDPTDGISLVIAPRPGSQLADAGLTADDVVVSVDGDAVRTNVDLQTALRRRPLNEPATIEVVRAGQREEIEVARVSDLPS